MSEENAIKSIIFTISVHFVFWGHVGLNVYFIGLQCVLDINAFVTWGQMHSIYLQRKNFNWMIKS